MPQAGAAYIGLGAAVGSSETLLLLSQWWATAHGFDQVGPASKQGYNEMNDSLPVVVRNSTLNCQSQGSLALMISLRERT